MGKQKYIEFRNFVKRFISQNPAPSELINEAKDALDRDGAICSPPTNINIANINNMTTSLSLPITSHYLQNIAPNIYVPTSLSLPTIPLFNTPLIQPSISNISSIGSPSFNCNQSLPYDPMSISIPMTAININNTQSNEENKSTTNS